MNAGPVAFRLGLRGMTIEAESRIVERDIQLLREIEASDQHCARTCTSQHVSTAQRARSAMRAPRQKACTSPARPRRTTSHLTDEAVGDYNTNAKMNPPLRDERTAAP